MNGPPLTNPMHDDDRKIVFFDDTEKLGPNPTKLFFLFFAVKLGHFTVNDFFLFVMNMQAYQRKTEKFFLANKKTFYRIVYST